MEQFLKLEWNPMLTHHPVIVVAHSARDGRCQRPVLNGLTFLSDCPVLTSDSGCLFPVFGRVSALPRTAAGSRE